MFRQIILPLKPSACKLTHPARVFKVSSLNLPLALQHRSSHTNTKFTAVVPDNYNEWLQERFYNAKSGVDFVPKWLLPASLSNTMTVWNVNPKLTANQIYDIIDETLEDAFPGVNRAHYVAYEWRAPTNIRYVALVFSSRQAMLTAQGVLYSPKARARLGGVNEANYAYSSHTLRYSRIVSPDATPLLDLSFLAIVTETAFPAPPHDIIRLCRPFGEVYAMQAVNIVPQSQSTNSLPVTTPVYAILVALTRAKDDGDTMKRVLDDAQLHGHRLRIIKLGSEPEDLRTEETRNKILSALRNSQASSDSKSDRRESPTISQAVS